MMTISRILFAVCAVLLSSFAAPSPVSGQVLPQFGEDRAGTSGFQFLKVPVDARAAALGQSTTTLALDATSLFWNPALAARAPGSQIGLHHTTYFADISIEYVAGLHHFQAFGLTLGASLHVLDSGDMDVTTETQPISTGQTFRFQDVAAGLTLSQSLTDLFSYGVTAKYLRESVYGLVTETAVFDLGMFYRVGETGAQMAVVIRNFGLDASPKGELERIGGPGADGPVVVTEFESLTPPTTFMLGVSYDLLRASARNDLVVSGQLSNPNDNAESFSMGAEYTWNDVLILRGGYRFGVETETLPSVGVGLQLPNIAGVATTRFDYGFSRLELLGNTHRVGLNVSL